MKVIGILFSIALSRYSGSRSLSFPIMITKESKVCPMRKCELMNEDVSIMFIINWKLLILKHDWMELISKIPIIISCRLHRLHLWLSLNWRECLLYERTIFWSLGSFEIIDRRQISLRVILNELLVFSINSPREDAVLWRRRVLLLMNDRTSVVHFMFSAMNY
jgi:hypothetical protein